MPILPAAGALSAATLVLLGSATTARLDARWIEAPCATAAFTEVQTDAARNTVLSGQVEICSYYKPQSAFTLVAFKPDFDTAFAYEYGLVPHQPAGPQEVRGAIQSAPSSGTIGVCVMRGARNRIACVRLTFHLTEQTTMEPIPVDDQLVNKPVTLILDEAQPGEGFCGSCVDLPI